MVSTTVGNLITAAAEELEVIDSGGSLTNAEQISAIDRLNRLLDSSGAQRPLVFTERIDLMTLSPNVQSYTIGVDPTGVHFAAFNVPRPVQITRANLLLSSTVRKPLDLLDDRQWAAIRYQQNYGPPEGVYFDGGFGTGTTSGFGTMLFYLIPDKAYQWEMYSWQQMASVSGPNDLLNYPPGYADFWLYSLVMRMAPMFGRQATATHVELLRQARETLASLNCASPELRSDPALGGGVGMYNWLTGETE